MRRLTSILSILGLITCLGLLSACGGSGDDGTDKPKDKTSEKTTEGG